MSGSNCDEDRTIAGNLGDAEINFRDTSESVAADGNHASAQTLLGTSLHELSPAASPAERAAASNTRVDSGELGGALVDTGDDDESVLVEPIDHLSFVADRDRPRPLPVVEGYEILGELGVGGMGVVYRARRVLLNRPCALKMIRGGALDDHEAVARFQGEAEAIARLHHPNIVQIYHIGEDKGRFYCELEYIDGGSLDGRLDGTPWQPKRAADLVHALARGMAEAHRLGIVHRDLKPGNILIAEDGTPKITDFGLAKSLGTESGLTRTNLIMGSPAYMSPEQAEGRSRHVGPLADVYALGVILYELLTGSPPFRGTHSLAVLEQVRTSEPVPPSRLVLGLPADIETITLKCLAKEPDKRYETATALAEDLRRFLLGEPIVARPVPTLVQLLKWAQRRPAIASLGVAVLFLLFSLLVGGTWSYFKINRSLAIAKSEGNRAQIQRQVATAKAADLAWEDYINRVNRAYREVQDDNLALAEDLLHGCPIDRRDWEWHYVKRLCHSQRLSITVPAGSVCAVAYSPDGRRIATGSGGRFAIRSSKSTIGLWDRETGVRRPIVPPTDNVIWSLAFSPDGTKLALGGANPQLEVRDAATGAVLWSQYHPDLAPARSLAFSPDGQSLVVGFGGSSLAKDPKVYVYATSTGEEMFTFPAPAGDVDDVAFHSDGRRVALACYDVVEIWDVSSRTQLQQIRGDPKFTYAIAFSPDGKWLATGGWDRTIKLWDQQQHRDAEELAEAIEAFEQAEAFARHGQWESAAAAYGKFVDQQPDSPELRLPYIRSLAEVGNTAGVQRSCEDLVQRFRERTDLPQIHRLAWCCVLTPDAVTDHDALVRMSELALGRQANVAKDRSDKLLTLGGVLYRAGRFDEAVNRLEQSIQSRDSEDAPQAFAFLAMAHHRLGHIDEANRWLAELVGYAPAHDADFSWDDVDIRILRREAETLILADRKPQSE